MALIRHAHGLARPYLAFQMHDAEAIGVLRRDVALQIFVGYLVEFIGGEFGMPGIALHLPGL